jgi:hypothetical protein
MIKDGHFYCIMVSDTAEQKAREWIRENHLETIYPYRQRMPRNLNKVVLAKFYSSERTTKFCFNNKSYAVLFKLVFG